jgi:fibronectin type 3 domain-containing protein
VAGYRVYFGTQPGAYQQSKGNGIYTSSASYTISTLTTGAVYYFAVTAVDSAGNESGYSNEVSKLVQ